MLLIRHQAHVWVICVCLCVVVSNTCCCVVFLPYFSSSCVPGVASFSGLSFFWLHLKYSLTIIYYTYQHYCTNDSNECQLNISSLKSSYLMGIPRTNFLFPLLVTIKWCAVPQKTGGQNEPNFVFMRKSQDGTLSVSTHNSTTQKTKCMSDTDPTK
jgi:hypothetical protein